MRHKITVRDFTQGDTIKGQHVGRVGNIRLRGFKLGHKLGLLTSFGGAEAWGPAVALTNILGIKRWYRDDGGRDLFAFTSDGKLQTERLNDFDAATSLGTYTELFDVNTPVLFENCGSVLVVIPLTQTGRPYSLRIDRSSTTLGAIQAKLLGLDPPTETLGNVTGAFTSGTNHTEPNALDNGTYLYCITRCYGTREQVDKWGESAPGPVIAVRLTANGSDVEKKGIIQINGITPVSNNTLYQAIRVYRTLKNTTGPFYRVGEITSFGLQSYNDVTGNSAVDTSKVLPTATGLPTGMRCAAWHPTLKRLFWCGEDGYLHYSEPGYPDINPSTNKLEVGNIGVNGNGIIFIRGNIYVLREDGVFLVSGSAPNYVSVRVDENGCFARGSIAQAGNGICFYAGRLGEHLTMYTFNGNSSQNIAKQIQDALPIASQEILDKVSGDIYGDEYLLSISTYDSRYVRWPLPFNNVLFRYNYEFNLWFDVPIQAGDIEVLDGPGDSGELLYSESDPTASRGNVFCWYSTGFNYNQTFFENGVETYSKIQRIARSIFIGNIVSDTPDLQEIQALEFDVIIRGLTGVDPQLQVYADNRFNDDEIDTLQNPDEDEEILKVPSLSRFDNAAATYGTAIFQPEYTTRRHFKVVDDFLRTGVSVDLQLPVDDRGNLFEVEAVEFVMDPTEKE